MAYTPRWEQLSDALARVVEASGQTHKNAQVDICRAIADGTVRVRVELGRHATRSMTARGTRLDGEAIQIPTRLKPEDLDWQSSRPLQQWLIGGEAIRPRGYWNLERIELSRTDVTEVLCKAEAEDDLAKQVPRKSGARKRSRPAFERAQRAITTLYPKGVPAQTDEPNSVLLGRIGNWLKKNRLRDVSDDTILRAAERRK